MSRRQLVQIVNFAVRRRLPVERLAIPGGKAGFVVIVIDPRVVPDAVDLISRTDLVGGLATVMARAEIVEDAQRAATQTVGQQERTVRLASGERRGADGTHAEPAPFRARPAVVE